MAKHEKYSEMYGEYLNGSSLAAVAVKFGMTRQSVYIGFERRGYKLRVKKKLSHVMYDGLKFTLRNMGYYACTTGERQLLHRYKYQQEVERIPINWDVHHIDGNKLNNDIENLVAMPKDVHASLFNTGGNQYGEGNRQHQTVGERERGVNFYLARKRKLINGFEVG